MGLCEGILVGNTASGFFLVHSESIDNPYVASRPFRGNAGAVHAYTLAPGGNAYLNLHNDLPDKSPGMGIYRNLVDLMGHPKVDAHCVLWLIDGIYSAPKESGDIILWEMAPFNNDHPSSLFVSQDPLAYRKKYGRK